MAKMSIQSAIQYCQRMAKLGDIRVPLKICGQIMLSGVRKCFTDQADPEGKTWAPLKFGRMKVQPIFEKHKKQGRFQFGAGISSEKGAVIGKRLVSRGLVGEAKVLLDTGRLRASTTSTNADGSCYMLGRNFVQVGTNLVYARIHNDGGKIKVSPKMRGFLAWRGIFLRKATSYITIPQRRFIGHRPENIMRYRSVFIEWQMKRARAGA